MSEKIEVIRSPSGHCLVVNDIRVFGGKIHGVGAVVHRFDVDSHWLLKAIHPKYRAAISACHNIPTSALEAGVVEKMVEWARECDGKTVCPVCDYFEGHLNTCIVGKIIKLLEETK